MSVEVEKTLPLTARAQARLWRRIRPTLIVLAAIVGCASVFVTAAAYIGANCETFMKVSRRPTSEEAIAAIPIEYAMTSKEYNDVVFFGDSAPLCAIDPIYFEKLTGLKAYNLASFRPVSINGFLLTAQAYLANHPPPRLVVLCVSPEVPGGTDVERVFARRFVRSYGRHVAGASPAVGEIVNSVTQEDRIDEVIKRGVSIARDYFAQFTIPRGHNLHDDLLDGSTEDTFNTLARKLHESRGYVKPKATHGPPNKPVYPGVHFAIRPEWDRDVRALIGLTDAVGARLMVRLAPARTDAAEENFDAISSGLRDLQKEFPRVIVDAEVHYYEPALCCDLWHMNGDGGKKFTRLLADDVRSAMKMPTREPRQIPAAQLTP
jgi:hypothetical protein